MICPYCGAVQSLPAVALGEATCGDLECVYEHAAAIVLGHPSLTDAERNEGADL